MPGQAGTRGAAADQFIDNRRMKVVHGVGLHRRGVLPTEPERAETVFHFSGGEPDFFPQSVRAEIAVAHDTLGIAPATAARFGAAADDESRRRARSSALAPARQRECLR